MRLKYNMPPPVGSQFIYAMVSDAAKADSFFLNHLHQYFSPSVTD
jgi:hypothetical protein